MRTRWMWMTLILVLMVSPGILHAADAPGCVPTSAVAVAGANATASQSAPATAALPIWAGLPAEPSALQSVQGSEGAPLFLTTCAGCVGSACTRLHSCVLLHCC